MTKKPLSSISFNSADFLKYNLDELYKNNCISLYCYIRHYPEEDTKKQHYHLFLQPVKPIDPLALRKLFIEPNENGDLGCLPLMPSKFYDWLLYSLHHPLYLLHKGLYRINHYPLTDIVSSEPYYCLEQFYHDALEQYETSRIKTIISMIKEGYKYNDILESGIIPPSQIVFYDKLIRSSFSKYANLKKDDFFDDLKF